uniref:MFS domain-containing protein n=1 Tax=Panagrellus redivivus TaxID=6233 RepID=A0A7E4UTL4_PANRE
MTDLGTQSFDERTPLLGGSLMSLVTDPGLLPSQQQQREPEIPSTSRSIVEPGSHHHHHRHTRHGADAARSRSRFRNSRRLNSESDLFKSRRPPPPRALSPEKAAIAIAAAVVSLKTETKNRFHAAACQPACLQIAINPHRIPPPASSIMYHMLNPLQTHLSVPCSSPSIPCTEPTYDAMSSCASDLPDSSDATKEPTQQQQPPSSHHHGSQHAIHKRSGSLPRPIIASPFMPTVATQTAVADRRRAAAAAAAASNVENAVPVRSTANGRYGALKKEPVVEESHDDEEDEDNLDGRDGEATGLAPRGSNAASSCGDTDDSSDDSSVTRFSDLTGKQWAAIGMLAIANFCSTVAFSCIAPFYPGEAQAKGLSTSEIGIIFGAFEFVMFIAAPILGKYMHIIGSKRMFMFGVCFTGVTAIAFGFLNLLPAGRAFFWASLGVRCAEALGDAAFVTSSFVISAKCFPGRIATIVGVMETFAGLGCTAGPVIGGILYEWGGFQLPFFVLGALLIFATALSFFLIEEFEEEADDENSEKGMLGMLQIPVIWIMIFAVVICAISLSFFDPTLADHLKSFNLSTTLIGLMFLLCGGIYTATAPIWGLLIDRWHCCNSLMVLGSSVTVVAMLLIGPSPIFHFEKNLVLIGISLALLGLAAGALYIPTFQNCLDAVKEYGYEDSFRTYGCVSGVFQSAFAGGAFIGPTLGGFGVERIGFAWTTTIIAGINILFLLFLTTYQIAKVKCQLPADKDARELPRV